MYFRTSSCVLCREVYCTLSLFWRAYYQRLHRVSICSPYQLAESPLKLMFYSFMQIRIDH